MDKIVRVHHGCLRQSADPVAAEAADGPMVAESAETSIPLNAYGHPSKLAARTLERHALILNLMSQGKTMAQIAREQRPDRLARQRPNRPPLPLPPAQYEEAAATPTTAGPRHR